ncbi:CNH domain-containing protein, partial [Melanogaster broomeanus]
LDLLSDSRNLVYTCELLQPDTGFARNGWTVLFVFLFDHYLVMTKANEDGSVINYHVVAKPIPLDLLSLENFTEPPKQKHKRSRTLQFPPRNKKSIEGTEPLNPGNGSWDDSSQSLLVYPCTIRHLGRQTALHTLFMENEDARTELKQKLEEAITLRKAAQASNKTFELKLLATDTFCIPSAAATPSYDAFPGKFTCSVPFSEPADGRPHVAIGCADGVWIGLRHDVRSFRRVLPLKLVTQCALLEDFGLFIVLSDKVLCAYDVETLVLPPSGYIPGQTLSGSSDVQFFSAGSQGGHTRIAYMKKKGLRDSVFRVLEPTTERISERTAPLSPTATWFRLSKACLFSNTKVYAALTPSTQEFYVPVETFDLGFLKEGFTILSTKGFGVVNFADFDQFSLPRRDGLTERLTKRCEACKPVAILRVGSDFLLCYNGEIYPSVY